MDRKKIAVLVLNQDTNKEKTKKQENININLNLKKKKFNFQKIIIFGIILTLGGYYFVNQDEINKVINQYIGNQLKIEVNPDISSNFFGEDKKNETPDAKATQMNKEMQEEMAKRKQADKEDLNGPTVNLNSSDETNNQQSNNTDDDNLPVVNVGNKNNTIDTTVDKVDFKKLTEEKSNNENIQPEINNVKDNTVTTIQNQTTQISDNEIEKLNLEKALNMLIKNSNFSINAKPNSISLFINNINHNVGGHILNSAKFKLKSISLKCLNNKMPIFNYEIADTKGNVILSKDISYSENKKISLFFDSISIFDKGSNVENIYIPDETIFKGFKLLNITENGSTLTFDFSCDKEKISISGKELSEIN